MKVKALLPLGMFDPGGGFVERDFGVYLSWLVLHFHGVVDYLLSSFCGRRIGHVMDIIYLG